MTTTKTEKQRSIRYLNRDFESFKRDLIEHLRIYFPDTVQDFNESNSGMFLMELMAFIGDNMSFYLDKKFEESFIETAQESKNLLKHAKQLGFKPFGKTASNGNIDGFIKLPARTINEEIIPDTRFAGTVKRGARFKSSDGESFETLEDAEFDKIDVNDEALVQVGDRDPTTNEPTTFVLKLEGIPIKSGETKTTTFTVAAFESFKKLTINEDDVLEIIKVTDTESNEWFEVDFLAQDTIFSGLANTGDDLTEVPSVLKLKSVPFRFISEFDIATNRTSLIFGTGDAQKFDGELIPDLGDLSLPVFGKETFGDFALDPQNFLKTRTLGLAPVNTTLTVKYRVGGGAKTNVGAAEINTVAESTFDVGDSTLDTVTVKDVANSFSVLNPNPIQGGKDELPLDELRQLISANFSTQSRMVTAQDFVARTLSMPAKFGSVFRANARPSMVNKNAVELVVLSRNSDGLVTVAPGDLKTNLKTYLARFRMMTDAIEILDGEIVNIGVNFEILTNSDFNKIEVLANAIEVIQDYFKIELWQINQPINITDIYSLIADVPGVLSLINITIRNLVGNVDSISYSNTVHNIDENSQNGIIYSDENKIFEVKFPNKNITGTAK